MKKLKVLGLAAIAAGMFSLTSCLDGGGNTQQLSSYAIVDYSSTMRTLIYPLGYYPLYFDTIANYQIKTYFHHSLFQFLRGLNGIR